jgi:tRNA threonylcarbamoyladenosine modification (KEOPS) complex Cgi121 subunit
VLKRIEEFGKYLEITGFRNVTITSVERFLETACKSLRGVDVQLFDAATVATWEHLYFAALNALTAFKNHENVSKSLAMETMLCASAQRQIKKATALMGIKPTSSDLAVLILGEEPDAVRSALSKISESIQAVSDDTVLKLSGEKVKIIRRIFDINEAELQTVISENDLEKALVDLVIERMALSTTQR